jgi:hypothetical protein
MKAASAPSSKSPRRVARAIGRHAELRQNVKRTATKIKAKIPLAMPSSPFDRALRIALDVPPGAHFCRRNVLALFHGRASWDRIRHWRDGTRGAPQWAVELVRAAALSRLARARADALAVTPGIGMGHGIGARALAQWRAKRAKEKAGALADLAESESGSD